MHHMKYTLNSVIHDTYLLVSKLTVHHQHSSCKRTFTVAHFCTKYTPHGARVPLFRQVLPTQRLPRCERQPCIAKRPHRSTSEPATCSPSLSAEEYLPGTMATFRSLLASSSVTFVDSLDLSRITSADTGQNIIRQSRFLVYND